MRGYVSLVRYLRCVVTLSMNYRKKENSSYRIKKPVRIRPRSGALLLASASKLCRWRTALQARRLPPADLIRGGAALLRSRLHALPVWLGCIGAVPCLWLLNVDSTSSVGRRPVCPHWVEGIWSGLVPTKGLPLLLTDWGGPNSGMCSVSLV